MKNTLLLMIDFQGQPGLQDQNYMNSRYVALLDILNRRNINREKCIIVYFGTKLEDKQLMSMIEFSRLEKWQSFDITIETNNAYDNITIDEFCKIIKKYTTFEIAPHITNIIVGGTETSGCVFDNKNVGAFHWALRGYDTSIYLPLCCDFSSYGLTWLDKQKAGLSIIFQTIKNSEMRNTIIKNLSLTSTFDELGKKIPWTDTKITAL